jgi:hypothetical protein
VNIDHALVDFDRLPPDAVEQRLALRALAR